MCPTSPALGQTSQKATKRSQPSGNRSARAAGGLTSSDDQPGEVYVRPGRSAGKLGGHKGPKQKHERRQDAGVEAPGPERSLGEAVFTRLRIPASQGRQIYTIILWEKPRSCSSQQQQVDCLEPKWTPPSTVQYLVCQQTPPGSIGSKPALFFFPLPRHQNVPKTPPNKGERRRFCSK